MNNRDEQNRRERQPRERRGRGMREDEDAWRARAEDEERARRDTEWREYVNPNFREQWRTHFRGGYGNPGMAGHAAWDRSGLGAGYGPPGRGSGQRSEQPDRFEGADYEAHYRDEEGLPFRHGQVYRGGRRFPAIHQREQDFDEDYFGLEETFGESENRNEPVGTDWANLGTSDWGRETGMDYAGHGPEGYRRSDQRIYEDVCDRLTEHSAIDARGIRVHADNGEVTLEGTVANRQAKRLAETIAESASGVRDVHNRLRIAERAGDVP